MDMIVLRTNTNNFYSLVIIIITSISCTIRKLIIMLKYPATLLILYFISSINLFAQENRKEEKKELEEMRLKLNEDGSHYLKLTVLGQI